MSAIQKTAAAFLAVLLMSTLLIGCCAPNTSSGSQTAGQSSATSAGASAASAASSGEAASVIYQNETYGFTFTLPEDWKGYSIITDQWEGLAAEGDAGDQVVATGPQLSIRDPRWTEEHKRQDIPIMIFTLDQWEDLQQDTFHIGAAPVNPSELGRNNQYVFALPARYNFSYDDGYEEVETILEGNPLQANQL